jgi:hypothetical protein
MLQFEYEDINRKINCALFMHLKPWSSLDIRRFGVRSKKMPETQPDFTAEMLLSRTFRLEIS